MWGSGPGRHRFVAALSSELARRGWDGVVLDLEALPDAARGDYPHLVRELAGALGHRQVVVAVPAAAATAGGGGGGAPPPPRAPPRGRGGHGLRRPTTECPRPP